MRSYCLSRCISTARTGQISFTFGTDEVKIWLKQGKGIGYFKWKHNFYCCRRHKNAQKSSRFEWSDIRLFGQSGGTTNKRTCHIVTLYIRYVSYSI